MAFKGLPAEVASVDGIYVAYMTGEEGNGFALLAFVGGKLAGTDPYGVTFDGTYTVEGECLRLHVNIAVPAKGELIQGTTAGPSGLSYEVVTIVPIDFEKEDYRRVDTPLGAVNLRLRKLRSLGF